MLTSDQITQFRERGYVVVPHFFDKDEVRLMQAEIERLKHAGLLHNVATDGDGTTHSTKKRNLQLCPSSDHSEPFKALPFDEKVKGVITELIGAPARIRLDQIFLKPARDGAGTSWHQDNAYFQVENPLMGTAMWIAVHDATVENGTMHMVPGLHLQKLDHTRDGDSDHHVRCYPPEELEEACEIEAGGVVFFTFGTPHATKGNTTDKDRAGLAYHFVHADHFERERFPNESFAFAQVTGEGATDGEAEYGRNYAGAWRAMVQGQTAPV